jgi:hypothetical protein
MNTKTMLLVTIYSCLMIISTGKAQASPAYIVNTAVLSGGGGTSSSDTYQLSAILGQPAAIGVSTNAAFTNQAGFWTSRTGDTTVPVIQTFNIPLNSASLIINITDFTVTDNSAIAGYMITETDTVPDAGTVDWSATKPARYVFLTEGQKTLYAWVKDTAGNVSESMSAQVTITLTDTAAPVVTKFTLAVSPVNKLAVPVTAITATDNVAVTGYLITESSTPPDALNSGWNTKKPNSYSATTAGEKNLYAWAKDAAGNVSAAKTASVTITLPKPVVTAFTLNTSSNALEVLVTAFEVADINNAAGYLITATSTVPVAGWSPSKPTSYTFSTAGAKTLYAWVKDDNGIVSAAKTAKVTVDLAKPVVAAFKVKGLVNGLTIPVTTFTATDKRTVAGYLITESASVPPANAFFGWTPTAPKSYTAVTAGNKTLYAWIKNSAGSVSEGQTATTTIDMTSPDVTFDVPAAVSGYSTSRTIPVTFNANDGDGSGIAGYMITTSSAQPTTWKATKPTAFVAKADGSYDLYAWAKDKAGNISAAGDPQTVMVDTKKPVVTFSVTPPPSGLTVPVTLSATDNGSGVNGYLITETTTVPTTNDPRWSDTAPISYTFSTTGGAKKLYAWAKDYAGNISASKSASMTIPNTSLSGKVTSDGATGIAGVSVSVYNAATGFLAAKTVTATGGTYTVPSLAKGTTCKIFFDGSALLQNYGRGFYSGNMADFVNATPVTIASNPVTGINAALSAGGSISGTVKDGVGDNISGVGVSIYTTDGRAVFGATSTTDNNGIYTIRGLPPGGYRIQFDDGGTYAVKYNGDKNELDAANIDNKITVIAGQVATVADTILTVTVPDIASIAGQVTDGTNGVPNVGVSVFTDSGSFVKSAISDTDGTYSVTGLTSGAYKVLFDGSAMGYSRVFNGGEQFDIGAATPVMLSAPNQTGSNAVLSAAGSISGRVTVAPAGTNGIADIRVSPLQMDNSSIFGATRITDANGNYTLSGMPQSNYKIRFDANWTSGYYTTNAGQNCADLNCADSVLASGGPTTTGVDAQLAPPHVVINEISTGGLLYSNDEYVELFNPGISAIDLSGYRLVYRSAAGGADNPSSVQLQGALAAGGYLLFTGSDYSGGGSVSGSLPFTLSGTGGGVAIRDSLSGTIIDSVGYGNATNLFVEGTAAPAPPAGQSISRSQNGADTNDNSSDFIIGERTPGAAALN